MASITIKDVARNAKVSVGTASMALNGNPAVKDSTIVTVKQVAEQLGYRPNKHARMLTSKRTRQIGLCITDIVNPFFGLVIDYIQRELDKRDYELSLGITKGSSTEECKFINKMIDSNADGILLVPSHKQKPNIQHLHNLQHNKIPLCFITAYYNDVNAPCVLTDLSDGSRQLTRYLLDCGLHDLVYIVANRSIPVSNLRAEGFFAELAARDEKVKGDLLIINEPSFENGYAATKKMLKTHRPDAILAMNDIVALGAVKAVKEAGLRVPEDVSVAGYDDLFFASLIETPLTTVRQPIKEMCKSAVEVLIDNIENGPQQPSKMLLRPQLIIRESTITQNR